MLNKFLFSYVAFVFSATAAIAPADPTSAPALPVTADPTAWTAPVNLPSFTEIVKGAEYQTRYRAVLDHLPDDLYSGAPAVGRRIFEVDAGSQAERLGIEPGDFLLTFDGARIIGPTDIALHRSATENQIIRVWSTKNKAPKLLTVVPGMIGLTTRLSFRVDQMYVQSLAKGATPDNDLLVAAIATTTDPDLAETALFNFARRDKANWMLHLIACKVMYEQARFEDSMAFANAALGEIPSDLSADGSYAAGTAEDAAIASFHLPAALNWEKNAMIQPQPGDSMYGALPDRVDLWKRTPALAMANPVEEFTKLHSDDFSRNCTYVGLPMPGMDYYPKTINAHGSLPIQDEAKFSDRFENTLLGPTGANVDFSATVHFKSFGNPEDKDRHFVIFKIRAGAMATQEDLCLRIDPDGLVQVDSLPSTNPVVFCRGQEILNDRNFKIRMTVVGNRTEVVFNGKRLFYGPAIEPEGDRQLCVCMMMTGVKGELSDFTWRTAQPRGN